MTLCNTHVVRTRQRAVHSHHDFNSVPPEHYPDTMFNDKTWVQELLTRSDSGVRLVTLNRPKVTSNGVGSPKSAARDTSSDSSHL